MSAPSPNYKDLSTHAARILAAVPELGNLARPPLKHTRSCLGQAVRIRLIVSPAEARNHRQSERGAGKIVHAILDNYATHKHPKVIAWLGRHPRWTFHFTPTSCSWLNAVEGFFAKLAKRRLKRGVFRCVVDLQATINRFVAETNLDPKPFTWTAPSRACP